MTPAERYRLWTEVWVVIIILGLLVVPAVLGWTVFND